MTRGRWWLGGAALAGVAVVVATTPPALPDYAAVRAAWRPSEAVLQDRFGRELGRARVDATARRGAWVPLTAMSPALRHAAVVAEDHRFLAHHGIDWRAVAAGFRARAGLGGRVRGASTITMQLAGLLSPDLRRPGRRSILQKIAQARAADVLERHWTKAEILEAYLNLVPTRGDLIGVDASTRALFGVAPAGLTGAQAAALVALLPAPGAGRATLAGRACAAAQALGGTASAAAAGAVDAMLANAALAQRGLGPDGAPPAPGLAPQLAARLLAPGRSVLRTTLDADVQRMAADALGQRLAGLDGRNARDGAAVVVDNASGEVRAYVASAGPHSAAAQVDGADAPRQAGSTLKPFLYALAIGNRQLTAASILDDAPVHLDTASGLYVPQDYDRQFRGPVTVRSALGNSLNVPAVRALLLVGVDRLRDTLHDLGYAHIVEDGEYYGFSLALGSAEVTLLEQAAAYRALARGGLASALRLTPGPRAPDRPLLDPRAAAIVADILADPAAREATFGADSALALPFWAAVKTGTSKAMRDNWCVGFSTRYTVAVWVGNFEGDAMTNVSGVTGAAPAWRAIMLGLHADAPPAPRLSGVETTVVSFAPAYEPPRREWFIPGTALTRVRATAPAERMPRIAAPADGSIIALDPDIPAARQRVPIRLDGAPRGTRLLVDDTLLSGRLLWAPTPGAHRVRLLAADGRALDSVRLTVR